jgi:UDP-N-acetyl-D-mannosaminuronic acid transferase (WecB/TagA/CpsF family)
VDPDGKTGRGALVVRVELLDVPIDFVEPQDVVSRVVDAAKRGQFFQVATVNVDFLVNSQRDAEVAQVLGGADVNVADGAPVAWAARLLGCSHARRLAGVDLVPEVVGEAAHAASEYFCSVGRGDPPRGPLGGCVSSLTVWMW